MELFEALDASRAVFAARLAVVRREQWHDPTPCDEWDVHALLNHVVGGCVRYTMLLHGASAADFEASRSTDHVGADPSASFAALSDEMIAAFHEPDALARTVHHPMGDIPATRLLLMRIFDFTVHAWDLARATGGDDQLDPAVVDFLYAEFRDGLPSGGGLRFFKPARHVAQDAPAQQRLLALAGRVG